MKFIDVFSYPQCFSNNTYIITGELSAENAAAAFQGEFGFDVTKDDLVGDRVRFGFPPSDVEDAEPGVSCWYTNAGNGKGTKSVWVYIEGKG